MPPKNGGGWQMKICIPFPFSGGHQPVSFHGGVSENNLPIHQSLEQRHENPPCLRLVSSVIHLWPLTTRYPLDVRTKNAKKIKRRAPKWGVQIQKKTMCPNKKCRAQKKKGKNVFVPTQLDLPG